MLDEQTPASGPPGPGPTVNAAHVVIRNTRGIAADVVLASATSAIQHCG